MSKGKKDKNRVFTVNLKHDGIFSPYPFFYINGDEKQLTNFDFEGMSYDNLRELIRKLVHSPVHSLYYCKFGKTLKQGLCFLKNDADVQEFLRDGYESKWVVNLYTEHYGYDAMDFKNSDAKDYESADSSDAYCSSDDEEVIDYVNFYHERDQNVVIKNITTNDPFLTKLCSNNGNFRGFINEPILVTKDLHIEDPDSITLEPSHQIKRGIAYPRHDPLQPWNEMQPILGMRYDHPEQLKLALANYGVVGRCAGYFSKKVKAKKQLFTESHDDANKGEGTSKDGEGCSRNSDVSPKWTKGKIASSRKSGQPQCGFRLWASWMGTENSFQIKSLKAEHKCARNYNLGSLVTYTWIAHHFTKEIIAYLFIPLLKIKVAIREKFLINVSLGQFKRAKQRALYDFEGGLIEHYGRLWEYRQAILDTNLDGWKAGCRRVIGLDGCFLKHTCRGELLIAIGRDANNQMYLIAWAVVKVENSKNWCWFLSLLLEDLKLGHRTGITVISDSHKGLLDAASDCLPNAEH
ncbi:calcium/proton exchanger [Tanacetum coccineum]